MNNIPNRMERFEILFKKKANPIFIKMPLITNIANVVSMIGTVCGLSSRVPQVYRTYTTQSAGDLSTNTMTLNITANSCFLFYTLVHRQYPLMINCLSVILLEGSLLIMKNKLGTMKKTSSQTDLLSMVEESEN